MSGSQEWPFLKLIQEEVANRRQARDSLFSVGSLKIRHLYPCFVGMVIGVKVATMTTAVARTSLLRLRR